MGDKILFTPIVVDKPKVYDEYTEDELALSIKAMYEYNSNNVYSANEIEEELNKKYKL